MVQALTQGSMKETIRWRPLSTVSGHWTNKDELVLHQTSPTEVDS